MSSSSMFKRKLVSCCVGSCDFALKFLRVNKFASIDEAFDYVKGSPLSEVKSFAEVAEIVKVPQAEIVSEILYYLESSEPDLLRELISKTDESFSSHFEFVEYLESNDLVEEFLQELDYRLVCKVAPLSAILRLVLGD